MLAALKTLGGKVTRSPSCPSTAARAQQVGLIARYHGARRILPSLNFLEPSISPSLVDEKVNWGLDTRGNLLGAFKIRRPKRTKCQGIVKPFVATAARSSFFTDGMMPYDKYFLSAQEHKTRHQFVTKNRVFSRCFEVCGMRKSKTSKGF